MKKVNWYLTEKQLELLKKISILSGLSYAEIIRRLIDKYLIKEWQGEITK